MAQKGIREYDAKRMLASMFQKRFPGACRYDGKVALWTPETDSQELLTQYPWLGQGPLVVKPDQLFGKRGKHGLILLNASFEDAGKWIRERMNKEVTVGATTGVLTHFLLEPFVPHEEGTEHYVAIRTQRDHDVIYLSMKGGIHVEEHWDEVCQVKVPLTGTVDQADFSQALLPLGNRRESAIQFVKALYEFFAEGGFAYLEINPFVLLADGAIVPLDMVAKVDDTAAFDCRGMWGNLEFPQSFGKKLTKEEEFVTWLDSQSGASLKLTILNPDGVIWPMVAGGGASVIYADTVCDLGHSEELAVYGEYSGDPSTELTYQYAKTLLDLMTRKPDPRGKVLLIGGGIANFTDVAKTFTGIVQALTEFKDKIVQHNIRIFVRRGGPNYKEGLENMRRLGQKLGIPIEVYGPETHMTRIVPLALHALKVA